MELLTLSTIIAGVIAAIIGVIVIVRKISAFYKQRFQFSIWSGVLLFVLALSIIVIIGTASVSELTMYVLLAIAALLAILTIYNDIRLSGIGWGTLAVTLQILFSLCFVFLILFALIGYVMKKIFNIHSSLLNSIFGTGFDMKIEFLLLLHFLYP